MKNHTAFLLGLLLTTAGASAKNTSSLKSLGNAQNLMEKANAEVPANVYRVVQKRTVDRDLRLEVVGSIGGVSGGDSYYSTKTAGVQLEFHLTPRWSLGGRYNTYGNNLSPEGERIFDRAQALKDAGRADYVVPYLDQPQNSQLATLSFYPIYGKVSWFESTVSYFDFYLTAGAGQINLKSGNTGLATAGGGMGLWWNNYITTRLELRYETYKDQALVGGRKIETAVANLMMGIML
jgi:outer membrane immunogenic protein